MPILMGGPPPPTLEELAAQVAELRRQNVDLAAAVDRVRALLPPTTVPADALRAALGPYA